MVNIIWNPIEPRGFLIEVTDDFRFIRFIEEPPGNTLTFNEVVAENNSRTIPPLEQLTEAEVTLRSNDAFANSNNIEITDRTP